jgi:hypothetical protein
MIHHIPAKERPRIAAAIIEYRNYLTNHPEDKSKCALLLAETVANLHKSLHARRDRNRAIGFDLKA